MAEAMIGGLLAGQVCSAELIWATDPVSERRDRLKGQFGIRVGSANHEAVAWADVVILAVKPQALPAVLGELGQILAHALVISIVAGVKLSTIVEQISGVATGCACDAEYSGIGPGGYDRSHLGQCGL